MVEIGLRYLRFVTTLVPALILGGLVVIFAITALPYLDPDSTVMVGMWYVLIVGGLSAAVAFNPIQMALYRLRTSPVALLASYAVALAVTPAYFSYVIESWLTGTQGILTYGLLLVTVGFLVLTPFTTTMVSRSE
ncbi:MAG: hypothetical protein ACKVPY_05495 [Paracoccaceae bacterium]